MSKFSCKELINVFETIGGVLHVSYKNSKCEYSPPKFANRLVNNGLDICKDNTKIPPNYLILPKLECTLYRNEETATRIDGLLWNLSPFLHKMIEYHRCVAQPNGEILKQKYHSYQEANTDGFTIKMDITNM